MVESNQAKQQNAPNGAVSFFFLEVFQETISLRAMMRISAQSCSLDFHFSGSRPSFAHLL
jgi:hypothetical protein